jgi:hypothetical protein
MNAAQRRTHRRRVRGDHHRWPLGTLVVIQSGHHSPQAIGLVARVAKHGQPCTHRVDCIVDFPEPVMDVTFGAARYGHYVEFRRLRRVDPSQRHGSGK